MTKEEYLRGFLLAGMYVSNVRPRPQPSMVGQAVGREVQNLFSLTELERLQQPSNTGQSSPGDLWQDSLSNTVTVLRHAYSNWEAEKDYWTLKTDRQVGSLNNPMIRVSQPAQWLALRESVFNRLENIYVFRAVAHVKSFLEKNVFLTPLLLEANSKIREYFGMLSTIALEVSLDPENGRHQQLWARIQTELEPADAIPLLTNFDDEWWLEASINSKNLLNIKLEYV